VTTPTNQVPNGTIQQGQIWTPAQWNTAWQSKVDASGGFSTNETLTTPDINDPTIVGGMQASPAITTPTVTGGTFSDPAITNPTVTGNLPVTGNVTAANIISGTFTVTLTGLTTTVTATATYSISGNIAAISIPNVEGTSNADTFTINGLPSILQPSTLSLQIVATSAINAGSVVPAWVQISRGSGTLTLLVSEILGAAALISSTIWATSGTKGTSFSTAFTYLLN
jgi:hypothetical protein